MSKSANGEQTVVPFNVAEAYAALSDWQRVQLGLAALILAVSTDAQAEIVRRVVDEHIDDGTAHPLSPAELKRARAWEVGEFAAWRVLEETTTALSLEPADFTMPDLEVIGVRQCRECGCIEDYACPEGCSWAEADLCSACVEVPA